MTSTDEHAGYVEGGEVRRAPKWATDDDPVGALAVRLAARAVALEEEDGEWTWYDIAKVAAEAAKPAPSTSLPLLDDLAAQTNPQALVEALAEHALADQTATLCNGQILFTETAAKRAIGTALLALHKISELPWASGRESTAEACAEMQGIAIDALTSTPAIVTTPIQADAAQGMVEALEPFARLLGWYVDGAPDNLLVAGNAVGISPPTVITVADLRRARDALSLARKQVGEEGA